MSAIIIVVVLAVVVAVAIYVVKRKPKELGGAPPTHEPSAEVTAPSEEATPAKPEPAVSEPDEGVVEEPAAEPDEPSAEIAEPSSAPEAKEEEPEAPSEPAKQERIVTPEAPGVKLDDKAESEAAERLEKARRERKLKRLRQGLAPTRGGLFRKIGDLFRGKKEIEPGLLEELEETLVSADVGVTTTGWLIDVLKKALDKDELADTDAVWDFLKEEVRQVLTIESEPFDVSRSKPYVILVVGVNGVGKTTTIGKLATQYSDQGSKVILAAADTFRAAAVNQLEIWGRRSNSEVVKSKEGADPSSVVFDAVKRATEEGADVVIADTAGRLHTKVPLMDEVKKISRVAGKALEGAPHQVLLVLDATTGQNATTQVAMFKEALDLSGLVVTKLDGTAKGGVVIGICHEHKLPIRFIGIGEAKDDLREFEIDDFVDALFIREEEGE